MIWYKLLDFIKTRNGQVLVFSVVVAGMFLAAARIHKARQGVAITEESRLPQLSQDQFWEADTGGDQFGKKEEFEVGETNPSSSPFRLPVKREILPKPMPVEVEPVESEAAFSPLPSLIVVQRPALKAPLDEEQIAESVAAEKRPLEFEPGRLLYCQLVSPVSSGQGNVPVVAQLTRAYVVEGKVVLPVGTTLSGQLEGANGDRMNFNQQWSAALPSGIRTSFGGVLQEASFDANQGTYLANDGLAGLPGATTQPADRSKKKNKLISTLLGAASRLAKDRVQTQIGEIVPANARNVAIEGSSAILSEILGGQEQSKDSGERPVIAQAGTPFYLLITGAEGE